MACPWWDDDYKHVVRSRHDQNQKGKSHEDHKDKSLEDHKGMSLEDHKGKNHVNEENGREHKIGNRDGKMKEQKVSEKSYEKGYNTGYGHGYQRGYGDGYVSVYEKTRGIVFGKGQGDEDGYKKSKYSCSSGYIVNNYVEYNHRYSLGYDHNDYDSDDAAGYENGCESDYGGWNSDNY